MRLFRVYYAHIVRQIIIDYSQPARQEQVRAGQARQGITAASQSANDHRGELKHQILCSPLLSSLLLFESTSPRPYNPIYCSDCAIAPPFVVSILYLHTTRPSLLLPTATLVPIFPSHPIPSHPLQPHGNLPYRQRPESQTIRFILESTSVSSLYRPSSKPLYSQPSLRHPTFF